ncbi:unnamed protein product, partial [Didymodactylos carnosus]
RLSNTIQAREVVKPRVHEDGILSVCGVDDTSILSGSQDRNIVWYDFTTHQVRRRWIGHEHDVVKVIYGQKTGLIISSSRDRTIRFWSTTSDKPSKILEGHELVVTGIAVNPDNTTLCSGSRDNTIRFWDTDSGRNLKVLTIGRNLITDIRWSTDGTWIAQTGEDKEIKIYDARTMTQAVSFPKKQYIQTSCDISHDNRFLISTSNGFNNSGAEVSLWDVRQRQLLSEFNGHTQTVNCARFVDHDPSLAISCGNDGRVVLWDIQRSMAVSDLFIENSVALSSIAVLTVQSFATSGLDGKLNLMQRNNRRLQLIDQ